MNTAASFIKNNVPEIMSSWKDLVQKKVPASASTNSLILYDHLPNILEDIADILSRNINSQKLDEDKGFTKIINNSVYHGRHRASTLEYTNDQVIHEYIIFSDVLKEKLINSNCYTEIVSEVLKYTIEMAMLKSADSFARSIQSMQEKLIGTLAHDIRNPLTAAKMSVEMMGKGLDEENFEKMRNITSRSVTKALNLIEGLMDSITIRAGEGIALNFEELNILTSIHQVYKEAEEIYTHKIIFNAPKEPVLGVFDEISIRRLLENLITNAVKYGDYNSPIQIDLKDGKDFVILSVHNFGNPIGAAKQKKIFDFLTKDKSDYSSYRNWGMGLALVKMVTEAHGGKIEVYSNKNEGTTFTALLNKRINRPGKQKTRLNNEVKDTTE